MTTPNARERREQAIAKHQAALNQLRAKAAADAAKERERARKAEDRMKVVLGGALLAAIRNGRLGATTIYEGVKPSLRPQDEAALAPFTNEFGL